MEVSEETIKEVADKIRDLINDIKIMNEEEVEGTKKVEDNAAEELTAKLREIAQKLGSSE